MTMSQTHERYAFEDDLLAALLEAHAEGQNPGADRASPVGSSKPQPRRWGLVTAAVAAGVVIALIVPTMVPGGADAAASRALRRVALRAASQPAGQAPGPGQYVYTKTMSRQISTYVTGSDVPNFSFSEPLVRESWIGTDGSGRLRETHGDITFLTAADEAAWVAAGSPSLFGRRDGVADETFGPGELSFLDTTVLPDEPGALLELIERRELIGGPDGDAETFVIVGDLLRETWTAPSVRAALYEVVADLPGVELVGRVRDEHGREGIAVAYTEAGSRSILIFDPRSAELLGERVVLTEDSAVDLGSGGAGAIYGGVGREGDVVYLADFLASGVVDSIEERPSAG